MYYLLENNRIIDSRMSYTVNIPYWEIKDNCLFAKSKNDKLVRPYNKNKIKKQSENVYELIEVGDIVKYYGNLYEVKKFEIYHEIVYMDTALGLCMPSVNRLMELLKAIYKPDEKGNYIKVWEVKEDEKEIYN